jgi:hypothetical protein
MLLIMDYSKVEEIDHSLLKPAAGPRKARDEREDCFYEGSESGGSEFYLWMDAPNLPSINFPKAA